jgi:hypothetical protein
MDFIGIDPVAAVISLFSFYKDFKVGKIRNRVLFVELFDEFKQNSRIINDDYIKNDVPIERIIPVLKISKLDKAILGSKMDELNFNDLKTKKIDKSCFATKSQQFRYSDYNTEMLLLNIHDKINNLKIAKSLYFVKGKWSNKINIQRRFNNLINMMSLLRKHLSTK